MKLFSILQEMIEDDVKSQVQSKLDNIISKYEAMGMACWIYLKGNAIEIVSIRIKDETKRRQGIGTALMTEITNLCDEYNLLCVLTPEYTLTPKSVLLQFYKNFGFVSNRGRYKNFRFKHSMIRYPKK